MLQFKNYQKNNTTNKNDHTDINPMAADENGSLRTAKGQIRWKKLRYKADKGVNQSANQYH